MSNNNTLWWTAAIVASSSCVRPRHFSLPCLYPKQVIGGASLRPPISFLRGVTSCLACCHRAARVSSQERALSWVTARHGEKREASTMRLTLMRLRITINTPSLVPPHQCSLSVKPECLQRRINKDKEAPAGTPRPATWCQALGGRPFTPALGKQHDACWPFTTNTN